MADVELVLRFFAFSDIISRDEIRQNQIILSKFLNDYMKDFRNLNELEYQYKKEIFINTIEFLHTTIGLNIFRTLKRKNQDIIWAKRVNPVVFDAVCSASVFVSEKHSDKLTTTLEKYIELLEDESFKESTTNRTTNTEHIKTRISRAAMILYGVEISYE